MKTTKNEQRKIFEEPVVECNSCEKYWLSQCDGVKKDTQRKCTSYVAVRREDIPQRVDMNRREIDRLRIWLILLNIALTIHIVLDMFGGGGL